MKKILILIALLIAGVATFFLLNNPLGRLVKLAVEELGPRMTLTDLSVRNVNISASDGQGSISGLLLGNPKGFKTNYAMKADKIEIELEPSSIAQNVVIIHKVLIDAPQISYEKGEQGTNFDHIQRNVEQYLGTDGSKQEDKGTAKKMIIDSLVIRNAKVSYNDTIDLNLPTIELHNLGKNSGGATSAQIVKAIIVELTKQISLAIPKAAAGSVGTAIKGLFGK